MFLHLARRGFALFFLCDLRAALEWDFCGMLVLIPNTLPTCRAVPWLPADTESKSASW